MSTDPVISLPDGVTLEPGGGDLPLLRVDLPTCTGAIYLHGAHLTEWTPSGHDPVLWLGRQAVFTSGKAIRGGVPICLPWFGPGPDGDLSPAHGFARTGPWELVSATREDDDVTVTLALTRAECADRAGAEHWPDDVVARYTVRFGRTLQMTLNFDPCLPAAQAALHTYFQISDVRQVHLEGLTDTEYTDKLTGSDQQQRGDVTFSEQTDRIYRSAGAVTIVDPGLRRRVLITKSGSDESVVWNPWQDKAAGFTDMADDEWTQFVCVEAANLDAVQQLTAEISVERTIG